MEAMTCGGRANSEKEVRHELNAFPGMSAAGRVGTRPAPVQGGETVSREVHDLEFRVRLPALPFCGSGHGPTGTATAKRRRDEWPRRVPVATDVRTNRVRPTAKVRPARIHRYAPQRGRDSGAELHRTIEPDRPARVHLGCSREMARRGTLSGRIQ